ncbi:MAG: YqaJ viral recombinase family protein [Steroidobacteraceae bacterium]|nr:YqaJ viral recombinase family protein [Steroidobacteraceae bacterium]MDW8258359.1 YqaJ viral recombinase family protein [Gammaproteobacteria bacterium]
MAKLQAATRRFRLRKYGPEEFEKVHAPGSKIVTASGVPAIFGASRFETPRSYAQKLLGIKAEQPSSPLMELGRDLQPVALVRAGRVSGLQFQELFHFARHRKIDRFVASPDALVMRDGEVVGIAEAKLVTSTRFEAAWQDGPPVDVRLQVAAQLACTGASMAWIVAMVPVMRDGWFDLETIVYEEPRRDEIVAEVEEAVKQFIVEIDRGILPEPIAVSNPVLGRLDRMTLVEGKVVRLSPAEARPVFERWEAAKLAAKQAAQAEQEAKAWFAEIAPDAERIEIEGVGAVIVKDVEMAERVVKAHTARRYRLVRYGE